MDSVKDCAEQTGWLLQVGSQNEINMTLWATSSIAELFIEAILTKLLIGKATCNIQITTYFYDWKIKLKPNKRTHTFIKLNSSNIKPEIKDAVKQKKIHDLEGQ